jgi:DNA-binding beta-propeller fold protein YncE
MNPSARVLVGLLGTASLAGGWTAAPASAGASAGRPADIDRAWVAQYGGAFKGADYASDVAISPDGSMLFVTGGGAKECCTETQFATVAYNAYSGDRRWVATYEGPNYGYDTATAITVSPDGTRAYVTGVSQDADFRPGYATLAYDTATGQQLWEAREDNHTDIVSIGPTSVAVSPDGTRVFVTGALPAIQRSAWTTVAYDAATGQRLWTAYQRADTGSAERVAVSPDGSRVFVAGFRSIGNALSDNLTLAYDAGTGQLLDSALYDGLHSSQDYVFDMALSPDGSRVFVTGESLAQYVTIGYDASDLHELWTAHYGPGRITDAAYAVAVSPDGSQVSVTGYSDEGDGSDFTAVTYDAATGVPLWATRSNAGISYDLVYSTAGDRVFATGTSSVNGTGDYETIEYDAVTGAVVATRFFDGPLHKGDIAIAMVASPVEDRIFVTGTIDEDYSRFPKTNFGTIAYDVD